jgi:two-component system, OmpR family, phosphate regulon sensor histidine kinase PhoR
VNERDLERKAEIAELLVKAAQALGESLEPERVYERFHELLTDVVQHDGVVVSSYDDGEGLIRCDFAWVEGNRLDPTIFPPVPLNREGGGMQSRVIVTGEPLLVNDVAERVQEPGGTYYDVDREGHVRKLPHSGPPGTRAAMMIPVKHEGRAVGVVQVMSDREEYTAHQLELVAGLVAQMGAAVRNARLQTERRRLEAAEAAARAVAEEREQAAHVLEAVGDGVFLLDAEGIVRLWNRAATVVTGLPADRICNRPVAEAFPDWDGLASRIPIAERGGAARSVTFPVETGSRELWLSFVAVRSADGVVYAFRDLTSERRLDEEKSDFIATISHELRTPMAAVYGAAETLRHRELPPAQSAALLEIIASQAARLREITERVLLATQLDRGDIALGRERVDVAEVVRASVDAVRSHTTEDVALDVSVAPETGTAVGDPDRIQQVLINLLDNAVKYGNGPVTVRTEATNGAVRISVADAGPGITRAEQARIFEKFYRVDPQLTRAPSGTGLGLYISRELVQRMGGRLEVVSEPGSGATFVVELARG